MYIVAMWLRAPKTGSQGVNVVIHNHPAGLPHGGNLDKIIRDSIPADQGVRYTEIKPGGNRIQAALDVILEDKAYDRRAILDALTKFGNEHLGQLVANPERIDLELPNGSLQGRFMTNFGPPDPQLAQAVFTLLISTIEKALIKAFPAAA